MNAKTQNEKGEWIDAVEEPYYPNYWEKITHWLGKHWYYQARRCVICNKPENI